MDDLEELYLYVEGPMFDAFFNSEHTIGESSELYETSNRTKHIATFNRLVGSVRVRVVRETKSRTCGDNGRSTPIGSGFDDETSGMLGVCFGDVGTNQAYAPGDVRGVREARESESFSHFHVSTIGQKNITHIAYYLCHKEITRKATFECKHNYDKTSTRARTQVLSGVEPTMIYQDGT